MCVSTICFSNSELFLAVDDDFADVRADEVLYVAELFVGQEATQHDRHGDGGDADHDARVAPVAPGGDDGVALGRGNPTSSRY